MATTMLLPPDVDRARPGLLVYMWVGCGFATFAVAVRLYTRLRVSRAAGYDDLIVVFAYLFAIALYVGTAVLIHNGYGRHVVYIPLSTSVTLLKLNVFVNIMGFASLACSRTSIGIFLLRLVAPFRKLAIPIYIGLGINAVQAVALIIWAGVRCVPIQKQWNPAVSGHCINVYTYDTVERFFACLNVCCDLLFALYPLRILHRLQTRNAVRLAVYLLLSCGMLAAVCSIGRVVATNWAVEDSTYDLVPLTWWALSETTAVLILSCMPAFYQLFVHVSQTPEWQRTMSRLADSKARLVSRNTSSSGPTSTVHIDADQKQLDSADRLVRVRTDVYQELSARSLGDDASVVALEEQYVRPAQAHLPYR